MDMLTDFNLVQHVLESTHENDHLLDLIISRPTDFVLNVVVGEFFSDHRSIMFGIKAKKDNERKKMITSQNFKNVNTNLLIQDIQCNFQNLKPADTFSELDDTIESYNTVISGLIDKYAPLKTRYIKLRPQAPWLTPELMEEKKRKRRLERRWRRSNLIEDRVMYRNQRNRYNRMLNEAHTRYFSTLVSENSRDPKALFKMIDTLLNKKKQSPLPDYTSASELASKFNTYFIDKVIEIHQSLEEINQIQNNHAVSEEGRYKTVLSYFSNVSAEDVLKIIKKSPKKSCSIDPIPTWLLVQCQSFFIPIITTIINSSISLSYMPYSLKTAMIIPSLKKASMSIIFKNFRPISNLKYISKIIERVILEQFMKHLCANNLMEPMQSAYKSNHSTETALLRVQNDILKSMDNQKVTMLLLLDLSSAFDTVSHSILIQRLRDRVGVCDKALEWFTSYLCERKQSVCINNSHSEYVDLKYGVPQGSVLGPILFTVYTLPLADIVKKHDVNYHFYADDTQLYMSFTPFAHHSDTTMDKLSKCLDDIKNWMTTNMLKLNTDKTKYLLFGTPQQLSKVNRPTFAAAGDVIKLSLCERNLGVLLDSSLTMKDHISEVSKRSFQHLRNISHIRKFLTLDAAKTVIHALVCSHIDNNNSLYYGYPLYNYKGYREFKMLRLE